MSVTSTQITASCDSSLPLNSVCGPTPSAPMPHHPALGRPTVKVPLASARMLRIAYGRVEIGIPVYFYCCCSGLLRRICESSLSLRGWGNIHVRCRWPRNTLPFKTLRSFVVFPDAPKQMRMVDNTSFAAQPPLRYTTWFVIAAMAVILHQR